MIKKALVIYHAHCNDGFGAAFAFWKYAAKGYDEVVYHPGVYGELHPSVDRDTDVYVLDFSYSPEVMVEAARQAKSYRVLDHHKTAIEAWEAFKEVYDYPFNMYVEFDIARSGAMLALDYFGSDDDCNKLFEFLQDRDLWHFKNPHTKYFTRYLRASPQTFEYWNLIAGRLNDPDQYKEIINEGRVRCMEYESICKQIADQGKREVHINGIRGLECNCPGLFASDVGNILATESGTFAHTWELLDARSKHSLRSVGDFDVSAIAKDLGGGGHKNAAGFTIRTGDSTKVVKFYEMFKRGPF